MLPFDAGIENCVAGFNASGVKVAVNWLVVSALAEDKQIERRVIAHITITVTEVLCFIILPRVLVK